MRKKLISHPGRILKEEFLEPLGISVYALAQALDVPRTRLNDLVLGTRGISADTALRLAHFFGTDAQSWLNLQARYEIMMAEDESGKAYAALPTLTEWQGAMA